MTRKRDSSTSPATPSAAASVAARSGLFTPVRDAVTGNWVDRHAPPAWRPYLRLSRMDRPIGTWLLWIPCLWAITLAASIDGWRWFDLWLVAGSGIGALLMRGAGCTWNDIQDRRIDAAVARTASRPIPAGAVTARQAAVWMVAQALTAFLILLTFNTTAIAWGIAACLPVAVYPFAKRFTYWPQAFLGLAFNWGALLLWIAHSGEVAWPAVLLYLAGIVWTLHYDTIYAHQDREDDAIIGVKSTARLFGKMTKPWLVAFTVLAAGAVTAAAGMAGSGPFGLMAGVALGTHMLWQVRATDIDDPERCMQVFRTTRIGGLGVAGLFLLEGMPGL
ncbi:MAG: 4-hydroxybenzoate octaprenyltransferase [Pseudomonadota bacterium]